MKRCASLSMILLLSACGSDPGAVEVRWNFPDQRPKGCEGDGSPNWPPITRIEAALQAAAARYELGIDCRVGQAILLTDVDEDLYTLSVDALTDDGIQTYSETRTGVRVMPSETTVVPVTLQRLPGTIELVWGLPANCAADGVREVQVQVFDTGVTHHDETYDCDDGMTTIEGSWIIGRDVSEYALYAYGYDLKGVRTHDYAVCALPLVSGVVNDVFVDLTACPGADCCPGGLCRQLCPE